MVLRLTIFLCPLCVCVQGLEQVCKQGRALGFDGKSLIHPKTVSTAPHGAIRFTTTPLHWLGSMLMSLLSCLRPYRHERTRHTCMILSFPACLYVSMRCIGGGGESVLRAHAGRDRALPARATGVGKGAGTGARCVP
jgi:hypothetical protein